MQNSNFIVINPEKIEIAKHNMVRDGNEKLLILSDFDKTLTKCFVDNKKIDSVISILRDEHYLSADYSSKAQALFDKYHLIEVDQNIEIQEKSKLMQEWWSRHYELLAESGLNKKDLERVVDSKKLELRSGASEFFSILMKNKIPLVILSATGLGIDVISLYLKKAEQLYKNIKIASNKLNWDSNDKFVGVDEPIVHSLNKNYNLVKRFEFYDEIRNRNNIIFMGDSTSDIRMLDGLEYKNIIKIGFLNDRIDQNLSGFKEQYDVIIINDGSMDYIKSLMPDFGDFEKVYDAVIYNDGPMDFVNSILKTVV